MKLDKIRFARVIAYCISNGMNISAYEVETLDDLIDIDGKPVTVPGKASPSACISLFVWIVGMAWVMA
jgi:hypothetical protein